MVPSLAETHLVKPLIGYFEPRTLDARSFQPCNDRARTEACVETHMAHPWAHSLDLRAVSAFPAMREGADLDVFHVQGATPYAFHKNDFPISPMHDILNS